MNFLQKLFGGGDVLAPLRKAVKQHCWADALSLGEAIPRDDLEAGQRSELEDLLLRAGDGLASLNLEEGEAFLRAGDREKAKEHLALALDQACSQEMKEKVQQLLAQSQTQSAQGAKTEATSASSCGCSAGCSSASQGTGEAFPPTSPAEALDEEDRLELILAGYPADLAPAYQDMDEALRDAFLKAHDEQREEALQGFSRIPENKRESLFFFERGTLLAHMGRLKDAGGDLQKIPVEDRFYPYALDVLVRIETASGFIEAAEQRVKHYLSSGGSEGLCHGHLARLASARGETKSALDHGLIAIEKGNPAPDILILAASLLEQEGRLNEAEALLGRLPSEGCGGGKNPHLAEFWTRHGKHPDAALAAFKTALRKEPSNPRWMLRIAQVYAQRGWKKESLPMLRRVLADPELNPDLANEGQELLLRLGESR